MGKSTRPAITEEGDSERPLWAKLGWFVALWLAGVGTVTAVAYFIRFWIA